MSAGNVAARVWVRSPQAPLRSRCRAAPFLPIAKLTNRPWGAWGFVGRFYMTYSAAGIAASRGDTRSRRLPPPHPPAWRAWHRTGLGIGDRLVRAEALAPRCKKTCASGEVQ